MLLLLSYNHSAWDSDDTERISYLRMLYNEERPRALRVGVTASHFLCLAPKHPSLPGYFAHVAPNELTSKKKRPSDSAKKTTATCYVVQQWGFKKEMRWNNTLKADLADPVFPPQAVEHDMDAVGGCWADCLEPAAAWSSPMQVQPQQQQGSCASVQVTWNEHGQVSHLKRQVRRSEWIYLCGSPYLVSSLLVLLWKTGWWWVKLFATICPVSWE